MPRITSPVRRNIYRTGDDRRWLACIKRDGVMMHQSFHDQLLGGKRASLSAAKAWRDELLIKHPLMTQHARMQSVTVKNTSGVPGVFYWRDDRGNPYWKAQTTVRPQTVSRVFSVTRYGDDGAFQLAVRERTSQVERLAFSAKRPMDM